MQTTKQRLGQFGEDSAVQFLTSRGYQVIDRNYQCSLGEIDVIAKDGNWVVFVEVKTRSGEGYGHPFEAITSIKMARMRRLAAHWMSLHADSGSKYRIDAVSVLLKNGRVLIEHLKQVF